MAIGVQPNISITEARKTIVVAENNLRAVISPNRNGDIWQKMIVPADTPEFHEYQVDPMSSIDTTLRGRPELEQYNLQIEENAVNDRLERNLKKWQVDFVASFGASGLGGPQAADPLTEQPLIDPTLIGGFSGVPLGTQ